MPLTTDEKLLAVSRETIEVFDKVNRGVHPGFRPAHAKGILLTGVFTPSSEAASLTRAPHFNRNSTPVTVRFSNFAGIPSIADNDPQEASPRGFAVRRHQPSGLGPRRFIRSGLRARWQALFQDVDVVISPPMPTPAFPHDHSPQRTRQLDIDGEEMPYLDQGVWVAIATLNGFPATTMPIAHQGNLPIGVQIIGGFLDDNTTIAFAGMIEREFGGFTPPPGYA